MLSNIVDIGKSKGLKLNEAILNKYGIQDRVEIILEKDHIVIKSSETFKERWEGNYSETANRKNYNFHMDDVYDDSEFDAWK